MQNMMHATSTRHVLFSWMIKTLLVFLLSCRLQMVSCACPCKYCGPTTLCHNMGLLEVPYTVPTNEVTRLLLYGNRISRLSANEFQGMLRVTELDLHNNRITEVDKDSFSNLGNLESLHLSANQIEFIPPGALLKLSRLSRLFLDQNKLKRLPADIPCLSGLQKLNLGGNEIATIPWSTFYTLRQLTSVRLWNNPLHCDCEILELIKWFQSGSRAESLISDVPDNACETDQIAKICKKPQVLQVMHIRGNNSVDGLSSSSPAYVQSDTAILHCNASGVPTPLIVWKTPSAGYVLPYSKGRLMAFENGTLVIQSLRLTDTGEYTCHPRLVDDTNLTSPVTNLKVVRGIKPTITYSTEKAQGRKGSSVDLQCNAGGSPSSVIQWYPPKSVAALQEANFTQNFTTKYLLKDENTRLEIFNFSQTDVGTWRCRASNSMGFDAAFIQVRFLEQHQSTLLILIIAGCVVVAIIIVIVVTVTCVMARKRRRRRKGREEAQEANRSSCVVEEREPEGGAGETNESYISNVKQGEILQQPYTQIPEVKGIRI